MEQANNVFEFPNVGNIPKNEEQLSNYFEDNKKNYIDHIVDHYSSQLANKVGMHGFDIYNERFSCDFACAVEIFRASLYRSLEIPHALTPYMDEIISKIDLFDDEDFVDF
jgi:hypothetical protein